MKHIILLIKHELISKRVKGQIYWKGLEKRSVKVTFFSAGIFENM